MIDGIFQKEESILNTLQDKKLKIKHRSSDSFYPEGSYIIYNEDGIVYSCETYNKLETDLNNLSLKLQNFQRLIEEFKIKCLEVKT